MLRGLSDFLRSLPLPLVLVVYYLACVLLVYGLKALDAGLHELIRSHLP